MDTSGDHYSVFRGTQCMFMREIKERRKEGKRGERRKDADKAQCFPPRLSDPLIFLMIEERAPGKAGYLEEPPVPGRDMLGRVVAGRLCDSFDHLLSPLIKLLLG